VFRIVGPQEGARSYEIRELLSRMGMPYVLHSEGSEAGRLLLEEHGLDGSRLPVVVRYDGTVMVDPPRAEMLESLGMRTHPGVDTCDVVVLGAGPAGLAAGVYGSSEGLETIVLESEATGGQAGTSSLIRNYLGFAHGISGQDFAVEACEQAWLFGADLVLAQTATGLAVRGSDRIVRISDGSEITAKAVVIATGVSWRRLDVPSLEALVGHGVFYGAAGSEARAMTGQDVFLIGAGNSAGQAALHLAKHAASVTILVRGESLAASMSEYLVTELGESPNISVRLGVEVVDGHGTMLLEAITLRDRDTGVTETKPTAALFVLIGAEPSTDWLPPSIARDADGFILTGRDLMTNGDTPTDWPLERPPLLLECSVPGVFAAGDVRKGSVKRVASAVGEGATAIQMLHEYFRDQTEDRVEL
jgi:thioredoxin reductase (NADPH)